MGVGGRDKSTEVVGMTLEGTTAIDGGRPVARKVGLLPLEEEEEEGKEGEDEDEEVVLLLVMVSRIDEVLQNK